MPGEIREDNIEPEIVGTLQVAYPEIGGHHSLGGELGMTTEVQVGVEHPAALDAGTKVMLQHEHPELRDKIEYRSIGMVLGHDQDGGVLMVTLNAKDGQPWGSHNAYGGFHHELPDAIAALDRLFDPHQEAGAIGVLSRVTTHSPVAQSATMGEAACDSHEAKKVRATLDTSMLTDTYDIKFQRFVGNQGAFIRNPDNTIVVVDSESVSNMPDQEMRDRRAIADRVIGLSTGQIPSPLAGRSQTDVLNGIEAVVASGSLSDRGGLVVATQDQIRKVAERTVA